MRFKILFFLSLILNAGACSYQEPQIVIIDSNVSAFVYQGDERLGETPYVGKIAREKIGRLKLKKTGYKTVKVPVKKVYGRNAGPLTSDYTKQGLSSEDESMEVPMISTLFVSLPLSTVTDATMFVNGYWIEYMPNSFYVEMVPENRKNADADIFRNYRIRQFALKMYPSLAAGQPETLTALSKITGFTKDGLNVLLNQNTDPVSFAKAVTRF